MINPALSNEVKRSGTRGTITTLLNWKIKKWSIMPGISYQTLNIDNEFAKNPSINQKLQLPIASLNINVKEWSFSYNVNVRRRRATDLQPVVDNTNTLYQQLETLLTHSTKA